MRCRQLLIPAAVLAMVLAPPWGHPRALGGTYTWAPIVGYGYYISYPENQVIPLGIADVTIGYDPDNLYASFIDVSTGRPGYGVFDPYDFSVSASADGVGFTADDLSGGNVFVSLAGHAGPLNSQGDPESLDSLLGPGMSVGADWRISPWLLLRWPVGSRTVLASDPRAWARRGLARLRRPAIDETARVARDRRPSMILARTSRRSLTVLPKESATAGRTADASPIDRAGASARRHVTCTLDSWPTILIAYPLALATYRCPDGRRSCDRVRLEHRRRSTAG